MLEGKLALVTGASRGIGKAIALELAEMGARVMGTATSEAGAEGITETLKAHGGKGFVMDISNSESIEHALSQMADTMGMPEVLVNNAGMTSDTLLMRMKDEDWEKVIQTNLSGVYRLTKACLKPMLKARWGRIINLTSVVALSGNPGQTNYSAAKAGVIAFSKSLAYELGTRGITVNCIAPGFIGTDMTKKLDDTQKDKLQAQIPLGRMGTPEEIAGAVGFLASPKANYITGETLNVNGGLLMA